MTLSSPYILLHASAHEAYARTDSKSSKEEARIVKDAPCRMSLVGSSLDIHERASSYTPQNPQEQHRLRPRATTRVHLTTRQLEEKGLVSPYTHESGFAVERYDGTL